MPVNPTSNPNWVNLKAIKAPKSEAQPKRMLKPEDFKSTDAELLAERRRKDNQEYTDRLDRLATAKKAEDKNVIGDKDWRQNLADKTGAIGDKLRVSNKPNFFDDNINPAAMVGNMASSIGKAPKEAKESNSVMPYVTSIGTPIATGALAGIGANAGGSTLKGLARQGNELFNPLAGTGNLVKSVKTGIKDKVDTFKQGFVETSPLSAEEIKNKSLFSKIVYGENLKSRNLEFNKVTALDKNLKYYKDNLKEINNEPIPTIKPYDEHIKEIKNKNRNILEDHVNKKRNYLISKDSDNEYFKTKDPKFYNFLQDFNYLHVKDPLNNQRLVDMYNKVNSKSKRGVKDVLEEDLHSAFTEDLGHGGGRAAGNGVYSSNSSELSKRFSSGSKSSTIGLMKLDFPEMKGKSGLELKRIVDKHTRDINSHLSIEDITTLIKKGELDYGGTYRNMSDKHKNILGIHVLEGDYGKAASERVITKNNMAVYTKLLNKEDNISTKYVTGRNPSYNLPSDKLLFKNNFVLNKEKPTKPLMEKILTKEKHTEKQIENIEKLKLRRFNEKKDIKRDFKNINYGIKKEGANKNGAKDVAKHLNKYKIDRFVPDFPSTMAAGSLGTIIGGAVKSVNEKQAIDIADLKKELKNEKNPKVRSRIMREIKHIEE